MDAENSLQKTFHQDLFLLYIPNFIFIASICSMHCFYIFYQPFLKQKMTYMKRTTMEDWKYGKWLKKWLQKQKIRKKNIIVEINKKSKGVEKLNSMNDKKAAKYKTLKTWNIKSNCLFFWYCVINRPGA